MGARLNDVNEIFAAEVHVRQLYKKKGGKGRQSADRSFLAFLPLPHLCLHRG